ncbi:MAG: efflux RND transporter permease subunit, partial [Deltaproteobacteria bacterium]|nr:efflux RND transporter permease subunit [Deltaproteobacteria bacterium]
PFALAGAFWTLWLTGTDFDQPAAVGLLLLIGVVVNNGIVMIEHINQYRRRGMERTAAMLRGGRERLRPILMTAITTLVGLVPIAVQRPALAALAGHRHTITGRGESAGWLHWGDPQVDPLGDPGMDPYGRSLTSIAPLRRSSLVVPSGLTRG